MLRSFISIIIFINILLSATHIGVMSAMAQGMNMEIATSQNCMISDCATETTSSSKNTDCATVCIQAMTTATTAPVVPFTTLFGLFVLFFISALVLLRELFLELRLNTNIFAKQFQHLQIATVILRN